jgi:hypothetical protein
MARSFVRRLVVDALTRDARVTVNSYRYHVAQTVRHPLRTLLGSLFTALFVLGGYLLAFRTVQLQALTEQSSVTPLDVVAAYPSPLVFGGLVVLGLVLGVVARISHGVSTDQRYNRMR